MADIRIKDLTSPASSTASDDFIAVDGTTNGTRKLNAFSPTFGGNATVTGTLTANSAITGPTLAPGLNTAAHYFTAYGASTSWPLRLSTIYDADYVDHYFTLNGTLTGSRATPTFTGAAAGGAFVRANGFTSTLSIGTFGGGAGAAINTVANFNPTNVTIPQTTASTTTSTGALVVSGGVGVGGAIVAGGTITSTASTDSGLLQLNLVNSSTGTSASSLFRFNAGTRTATLQAYNDTHATLAGQLRVGTSNGDIVLVPSGVATATFAGSGLASFGGSVTSRIDVNGSTSAGLGLRQTGVRDWFISAESNELRVSCLTAASIFAFNSGTPVAMRDTTASTSTSSGALVVSGGVGVAGNANIGGVASIGGSSNAAVGVYVINTALTGTSQYGLASEPIWTSAANLGHTIWARTKTAASAFTLTAGSGVFVEIPTLGAGSSITDNYGVRINNQGTTGVTNAYGLYIASQSGASTLNYAIYTAGGRINFQGLPTSSAGLQAGTLWNDSGTLKVA